LVRKSTLPFAGYDPLDARQVSDGLASVAVGGADLEVRRSVISEPVRGYG